MILPFDFDTNQAFDLERKTNKIQKILGKIPNYEGFELKTKQPVHPKELYNALLEIKLQIIHIFNFFENLHYRYKNCLLEESLWAGWCELIRKKLANKGVKKYWDKNSYLSSRDFCRCVASGKCPKN